MSKDNSNQTDNDNSVSGNEMKEKVKAGFLYLKSNLRIIIIACIIGGSVGLLFSFLSKINYRATSTFVLEEKNASGMGSYAGLASQLGLSMGSDGSSGLFEGDNIIELYKSRSMLEKTLLTKAYFDGKQQFLISRFIEEENLRDDWKKKPQLNSINFDDIKNHSIMQDSIISVVVKLINKKYLSVFKPDKKLSIINVTLTYHDELFAKNFDEKLVENVNEFYVKTKIKKSVLNIQILKFQSDSVRRLLDNSLSGVASSVDASPNANPFNQGLKVPSQKRQVDVQTNAALYGEMVKNLALAQITMRQEAPLIQMIDAPVLPLDAEKLGPIKGIVIGLILGFFLSTSYLAMKKMLL